jgi:uncharacterized protein (TIGR04255 family)
MTFPKTQRVVFKNNPLVEVICQVRFPPVLEIASGDPAEFQKRIRSAYPLYRREDGVDTPEELKSIMAQLRVPLPSEKLNHVFLTEEGRRFVTLNREYVALTELQYERWESFRDEFRRAFEACQKVYQPSFYTRIGLRYRDVIDRGKLDLVKEPWESLICPPLLGPLSETAVGKAVQQTRTVTVIKLEEVKGGFVQVRHGLEAKPPDTNGMSFYVDADFFAHERSTQVDVPNILDAFNRIAGDLFRWAITPKLMEALGPVPVE